MKTINTKRNINSFILRVISMISFIIDAVRAQRQYFSSLNKMYVLSNMNKLKRWVQSEGDLKLKLQ